MDNSAQTAKVAANAPERKLEKILVVEDDNMLRNAMTRYLRRRGYEVDNVTNGFEALVLLQYRRPDLIIADIRMPKLSGLSMGEGLKNRPETRNIPIILTTAYRDESYYMRAIGIDVQFFLLKPFTLSDLQSKVEAALKLAAKQKLENR